MSRWKKISLAILAVLTLFIGTVVFLVGTTPGLHLLLSAATRWVPGLSIGQVAGGWRNLTLTQLRFQQPGIQVSAGQIHLSVRTRCLWRSQFCVNALGLKDINVMIDSSQMPPAVPVKEVDSGPVNLSSPYAIRLSNIAVENVNVRIDDTLVSLQTFHSGLRWKGRDLTLTPTMLQGVRVALPKTRPAVQASAAPAEPPGAPLGETITSFLDKPLLPELTHIQLPVNVTIDDFRGEQLSLTGDTDLTVRKMQVKLTTHDGVMALDTLDVDSSEGRIQGTGRATLKDNWPVSLALTAERTGEPLNGEKLALQVTGALRDTLGLNLALTGPLPLTADVKTQLAVPGVPLEVMIASPQLAWPSGAAPDYQVNDLHLSLKGKLTDYQLDLGTGIKGNALPPASITLKGSGGATQFILDKLRVAALEGTTELNAVLNWEKAISWHGEVTFAGINTAKQYPDWPSRLDGTIQTRGSLYGGTWQMAIPSIKLTGNVKQNRLSVDGQLSGNSYLQWQVPGVHVVLGRNTLDIQGELGAKSLALDANIDAPALDNALPGLGGEAKGQVKVRGDIHAPQLLANIDARRLRWQALSIGRVAVNGDVTSAEQIAGQLKVLVENIVQPGVTIPRISLDASGNENQHQLKLDVRGEPVSGHLGLEGHFDRKQARWQGTLSNTRFETPVGPWSINQAITLDYRHDAQRIAIGPHCWVNPNAQLCVPQAIDAGASGHGRIVLNRFDLALLKPVMPETTQVSGVFTGNADVAWDTSKPGLPEGTVQLSGKGVKVAQAVSNGTLPLAFDTLNVNASLHNDIARLDWLIRLTNNGQLDGNIQIKDPAVRRTLAGNVNLQNISLAMLNPLFSAGEKAAGRIDANLQLGGNAEKPQLFGQLRLRDLTLQANFMPFDMQPSDLTMAFNGMRSNLQGTVRTGRGQISLGGDADWSQPENWRARIAAQGSRVRITVPPMVRMDVSPDIVFEASPAAFSLNGRVDVPWARITVHDLPQSAVGVSSDEVMLDNDLKPVETKSASIPINSNLQIHLGNNVRMDAFGLKARLDGDLKVVQDKQGLGLNGQINIPEGRFTAYGQDLIVQKGILLFSGPPDQPLLNIEAIRNPDATENNVTAGVRVTGNADEPKVEIFSDPTMSQQEALSYLLRGQGLNSGQGDGAAMTSMLIGMGVAQSGQVVGKIGETFGVKNLALDTQGVGDSSQVVVSGYVLPGLQVKYGVGIFDSLATLTLRYRLMPKLYLEAVSGVDQALDLLYQFEF